VVLKQKIGKVEVVVDVVGVVKRIELGKNTKAGARRVNKLGGRIG
jgi:hypothetical protein